MLSSFLEEGGFHLLMLLEFPNIEREKMEISQGHLPNYNLNVFFIAIFRINQARRLSFSYVT